MRWWYVLRTRGRDGSWYNIEENLVAALFRMKTESFRVVCVCVAEKVTLYAMQFCATLFVAFFGFVHPRAVSGLIKLPLIPKHQTGIRIH